MHETILVADSSPLIGLARARSQARGVAGIAEIADGQIVIRKRHMQLSFEVAEIRHPLA